ncbi:glycosyltransferase [Ekhidna sp.]|uniref:glycosyltransferase n=1 Tax=Ekhidna sp. TaxID=2608089 RepID=UPI003B5BF61F
MNLFIVPSWYPSASNTTYGIFIKEQIAMMTRLRPEWKVGVSTWGQGDPKKLIWAKDHIKSLSKLLHHQKDTSRIVDDHGFTEYYQPALSWTKRFRMGNLKDIVRCNELNYQAYTLQHGKPDAIYVQAVYPGVLIGEYLAEKYKVPYYVHIRLGGFMFQKMLEDLGSLKEQTLSAISKADSVMVTSDFQAKEIDKWVMETKTIYNPVDIDFFGVKKGIGDYALAIGRLEPEKGFDILIDAAADIANLRLKIVGDGSQMESLLKKAKQLKVEDRIEFVGEKNREEVRSYIQNCQFLVLPSRYETFGNVLPEAMACGKPVVATKCGGPEEIVNDENGILSDINAAHLKDCILKMMSSYNQFDPNVIRGYVVDKFAPEKWMDKVESALKTHR